jgi:diguanylate cyclase (GGDEF)-like protein
LHAKGPTDDILVAEQFRLVVSDLPRLYVTVMASVAFVSILVGPVVSPIIVGLWAAITCAVAIIRCVHWWKIGRNPRRFSMSEMRAKLAQVDRVGRALLIFFASVGCLVLQSPDVVLRTATMLAIWAAAVGTAFYLSVLPSTARNIMYSISGSMCAVFLWSGGRVLYVVTPMLLAVSYALIIQLQRNFETFKAAVEANATIDALRQDALRLAMTDALTGLPNRRAFDERLAMLAANAQPFALASIDLDGFKPINDVFGHGVGDKALVMVAERLRELGDKIFASRIGGDEFFLLVEDADLAEAAMQSAVDALSAPYEIKGLSICMGASCGLAYWREAGDERELMERADMALYQAKAISVRQGDRTRRKGQIALAA